MKTFHCTHCGNLVYFENTRCLECDYTLAFLTDQQTMAALKQGRDGPWLQAGNDAGPALYKLCANYEQHHVCNWALPASEPQTLCRSCRLTRVIPNLGQPGNLEAWNRLETAKRRMLYTILHLNLPLSGKTEEPASGLAFEFLNDDAQSGGDRSRVLTGHDNGLITVNVAEADHVYRERQRLEQHEPYRTLLGHFRHEVGHYFWDRMIQNDTRLDAFRALFGDERANYQQSLDRHYRDGPPADWSQQFISAYASMHPWEDWAETWAHFMHMSDALQTARHMGLSVDAGRPDEPSLSGEANLDRAVPGRFDAMLAAWWPLTYALNNLTRGLGLADGYPFVLSPRVTEKLRFVHDVIADHLQAPAANIG
jgi:hypothetical protein